MVFSSAIFMFWFLAAVLVTYYIAPVKARNAVLLFYSLFFFYAWDVPGYALIMLFSTAFNFFCGIAIGKFREKSNEKAANATLVMSVVGSIAVLAFFKYTNLFISTISDVLGASLPLLDLALPIGISFYTFQTMSYTIDVWRKECGVQKNFIDFAAYVTMFPQLIAGPIVRYADVEKQLATRKETVDAFGYGVVRFTIGLAKKVIIANGAGAIFSQITAMTNPPVLTAWIGAVAYTFQIYFDFSGYSDMAIGLGKMFGFTFLENFDYPYISKSITEFWRRWHISLSTWFKEYVYIPLGGNRKGIRRQIINILVVWGLTGFWHGAKWNYLFWGLYFGVILILEKLFLLKLLQKIPKVFSHIYTMFLVIIGWVIFANENFADMLAFLKNLFCSANGFADGYSVYLLLSNIALWIVAIVCSTTLVKRANAFLKEHVNAKVLDAVKIVFVAVLAVVSIAYMVGESYNPFLYFRF